MKILITGGSGQLGKEIINESHNRYKLLIPDRDELDLSNKINCKKYIEQNKPDIIINSGAFTNVDQAEIQKDLCYSINIEAPLVFANVLKDYGGKLLQISSDYVFDGKKILLMNLEILPIHYLYMDILRLKQNLLLKKY